MIIWQQLRFSSGPFLAEPRAASGGMRRDRGLTLVNGGCTLTLDRRPVNPGWGQVVVMPNPKDSWVMGRPSLVLGWSIICLIKRERHQIIELLTDLAESHLSSDSGRDARARLVLWVYIRTSYRL